ncbi:MAG: Universal stress protein family protein, partial [Verrucomicrobia bacterium]
MKTILVPVDLSAATARVCAAACTLARLLQARLVLLHVVQPQPLLPGDLYAFDAGAVADAMAEREEILKHKWLESERLGYDIGFERALLDWIRKHRESWRA